MARDIRLGNAIVGFRADVNAYVQNLDRANRAAVRKRRALRALERRMRQTRYQLLQLSKGLFSLRAALGILAGGGGFGLVVTRASEAGASLFEMSVRSGLAVEELQTLGRVLEGDGVSTEKFNKTIIKLNQSLGAARLGLKSYIDAFQALGVDVDEVSGTADAIERIAEALSRGTVDRATAIYALQTVAGRNAALAFNALAQGSEVLREQQDEFEKLGIITTEQAAKLKVLAQTQTDLGNAIKANSQRIVADLAGLINSGIVQLIERLPTLFDRLATVIEYTIANIRNIGIAWAAVGVVILKNSFIGRLIGTLTKAIVKTLSFRLAITSLQGTFRALDKLTVRFFPNFVKNAGTATRATLKVFQAMAAGIIVSVRAVWSAVVALGKTLFRLLWPLALVEGIIITISFIKDLRAQLDAAGITLGTAFVAAAARVAGVFQYVFVEIPDKYLSAFTAKVNSYGNRIINFFRSIGIAAGKIGDEVDKIFSGEASISGFTTRVRQIIEEAKIEAAQLDNVLPEIRVDSPIRFDVEQEILDFFGIEEAEADAALDAISSSMQKQLDDVRAQWDAFTGDFEQTEFDVDISELEKQLAFVEDAFSSLEDQVKSTAGEIARLNKQTADNIAAAFGEAAKSIILDFDNIGDAVKNLARTIINELANRIIAIPITNAISGALGGIFPGIPGLQGGGRGSGLTLVGEAGPELVDFRRPGQVYSNERLRDAIVGEAGSGRVVVNQYFTINSADAGAVERSIFDTLPTIVDAVKGAVNTDARRPSATSAAFGTV